MTLPRPDGKTFEKSPRKTEKKLQKGQKNIYNF